MYGKRRTMNYISECTSLTLQTPTLPGTLASKCPAGPGAYSLILRTSIWRLRIGTGESGLPGDCCLTAIGPTQILVIPWPTDGYGVASCRPRSLRPTDTSCS